MKSNGGRNLAKEMPVSRGVGRGIDKTLLGLRERAPGAPALRPRANQQRSQSPGCDGREQENMNKRLTAHIPQGLVELLDQSLDRGLALLGASEIGRMKVK